MVREKISAALKDAMKAKNEAVVSTLRMMGAGARRREDRR
jgi:uncharacterized protein YqeY